MRKNNINVKGKTNSEYKFAMPFEELDGGGELHSDREASRAVLARGRAAIRLFSMGEL